MKARTKIFAAVVFSFSMGAAAGFVQVARQAPETEANYEQECYNALHDSFKAVWQGQPDPLKGKTPEPCTHLDEVTYNKLASTVMMDVQASVEPKLPEG